MAETTFTVSNVKQTSVFKTRLNVL